MSDDDYLERRAYYAYCHELARLCNSGEDLNRWSELSPWDRKAWRAAVECVIADYRGQVRDEMRRLG